MSKVAWTVYSLVGAAAWMGATVYAAATLADPSDAAPVLRTFAIGGGAFFGIAFVAAGLETRRNQGRASVQLYRRLAIRGVPAEALRAAYRQTAGVAYTYLIFGGLTTGLFFAGIGMAPDGPYEVLTLAAAAVVLVWVAVVPFALRRAFGAAGGVLAPLGLAVTSMPAWRPRWYGGGGDLAGKLTITGQRHGRQVSIAQSGTLAVTSIDGRFRQRSIGSANAMASVTGEPARCWRRVSARAGGGGVEVRRTGNGAGRWYLYDLLLAERLAADSAVSPDPPATVQPGDPAAP
jgi:hypothetical protein